ncbi:uncharacterized protein LOC8264879 [Ricinus communis]|uniref:uncharacterized protein LOC8264879 n=1 Tax=Ricinus communis TaxID=3988 RepID=UPI00201B1362|nr:uncharacterized protein LOC8264879 [Ricinus communis]
MGTKSVARKGQEREKLKNDEIDSSVASVGQGLSLSNEKKKTKTKKHEAKGNDNKICAAEEVDANVNNNEIEKDKKKEKKKRKSEKSDADMESHKDGKQDKAVDNGREVSASEAGLKEDQTGLGVNMGLQESGVGKDRKKDHKEKKSRGKTDSSFSVINILENELRVNEGQKVSGREDVSKKNSGENGDQKKKKNKKKKMREDGSDAQVVTSVTDRKDVERENFNHDKNIVVDVESSGKERKKKEQQRDVDLEATSLKPISETPGSKCNAIEGIGGNIDSAGHKKGEGKLGVNALNRDEKKKKKKSKKRKRVQGTVEDIDATNSIEKSTPKGTSKKVSFSEEVEVFPSSDGPSDDGTVQEEELVRGKRFSRKEDEMVKEAVLKYIKNHELGEDGLEMILHCKKYPEIKSCWKEIGTALPWRPYESVYYRAHILFERAEKRSWTEDEYEVVRKFHEKYGSDWRTLADALGKHRFHVKDAWRRIKVINRKKGKWSQEEYQTLFELVNVDLRMKAFEENRKSKHGMLRDNISWTAISEKLGSRTTPMCCIKWYDQLTSPMVAEGKWLDVDDYHLVMALYDLDACCMEDVDWDSLLEHRPGEVCRKRWNQMVKHLGENGNMSFADQVQALIERYCPDVLEARVAYYSKPIVN